MKLIRKILSFGTIGLLGLMLVGCGSSKSQKEADQANSDTNHISAYVNHHLNSGQIHAYTSQVTFDKISDTVEFHLNNYASAEMESKASNPTKTKCQNAIKHSMRNLEESTKDGNVHANVVYSHVGEK